MTGRQPEGGEDPLRTIRAERVERDDGRYLVYFSWHEDERTRGGGGARESVGDGAGDAGSPPGSASTTGER